MQYVYIQNSVFNEILYHSRENPNIEIAGFLIGEIRNGYVVINSSIRAKPSEAGHARVVVDRDFIARVADDIVKGRIRGRIVGWYHSHPGLGVFMSVDDLKTHQTLQQFDPNIVSMIVDSKTLQVGCYKYNPQTGKVELATLQTYSGAIPPTPPSIQIVAPTPIVPVKPKPKIFKYISVALIITIIVTTIAIYFTIMPTLIPSRIPTTPIVNVPREKIDDGEKLDITINFMGWPKENISTMMLVILCPNGTTCKILRENFPPDNITISNILFSGVGNYTCFATVKYRGMNITSNIETISVKYNKNLVNDVYLLVVDSNATINSTKYKYNNEINYTVILQPQTYKVEFTIILKYNNNLVPLSSRLREYYAVMQGQGQVKEVDEHFKVTIENITTNIKIKVFEKTTINITFKRQ